MSPLFLTCTLTTTSSAESADVVRCAIASSIGLRRAFTTWTERRVGNPARPRVSDKSVLFPRHTPPRAGPRQLANPQFLQSSHSAPSTECRDYTGVLTERRPRSRSVTQTPPTPFQLFVTQMTQLLTERAVSGGMQGEPTKTRVSFFHLVEIWPISAEFMRGSKMSTLSAVNMPSARPDTY